MKKKQPRLGPQLLHALPEHAGPKTVFAWGGLYIIPTIQSLFCILLDIES